MSHQIESMMYANETPWHGLGVYVGDENVDSATAIKKADLAWRVAKVPAIAQGTWPEGSKKAGEIWSTEPSDEYNLIVRNTDLRTLGMVKGRYEPLQNHEAFAFMDSLVEKGAIKYHTAGSLAGGKRIWILAQIAAGTFEVVKGDPQETYLLLTTSHDGSSATLVLFTAVRVVCANTLAMALGAKGERSISVRHTKNAKAKLAAAKQSLGFATEALDKYKEVCAYLASLSMNGVEARAFLETLIPDPEKGRPARARNKRQELLDLFQGKGKGSDIKGVRGTRWGMLNAVTEYNSHKGTDADKRMRSVWFGTGRDQNNAAASLLLSV